MFVRVHAFMDNIVRVCSYYFETVRSPLVLIPKVKEINEIPTTIEEDDVESENETEEAGDSDDSKYLCEGFDEYGNRIQ